MILIPHILFFFLFLAEVTRIDPFFGSTNGGTRVTIYGSGNKHFVFCLFLVLFVWFGFFFLKVKNQLISFQKIKNKMYF